MIIEVYENRAVSLKGDRTTQNENNVEEIKINVPEKYQEFNKKIVFVTDDGVVWDIVENDTYIIKNNITKYDEVSFYIWLTRGEEDFRSIEMPLKFHRNHNASNEITEEEIGKVNTVINLLEDEITKVTDLEKVLTDLINDIQTKLDNGEFIGPPGPKGEPGAIKMQFLSELPEIGSNDTLYFIPAKSPTEKNQYEEYSWINKGTEKEPKWDWEPLGTPKVEVDLEEYEKKEEHREDISNLQTQINNKLNKSAFVYDEETETLSITI